MPRPRPERPHLERRRGVWCIVWWDNGQRCRLSTGTADETGARQALADFEAEQDRRPLKLTVAEALARYITARTSKVQALDRLKKAGIETGSAEVTMVASTYTKLEGNTATAMQRLLDAIEDLDDTQNVYSNFEMDEESVTA